MKNSQRINEPSSLKREWDFCAFEFTQQHRNVEFHRVESSEIAVPQESPDFRCDLSEFWLAFDIVVENSVNGGCTKGDWDTRINQRPELGFSAIRVNLDYADLDNSVYVYHDACGFKVEDGQRPLQFQFAAHAIPRKMLNQFYAVISCRTTNSAED